MLRVGNPPLMGQKYNHRPGAYGVFWHKSHLLLTEYEYSTNEHNVRQLLLPGGGIDAGESAPQALIREAYEETGWHVSVHRKTFIYKRFVFMPEYDQFAEKICHAYIGRAIWKRSNPPEECHQARLVSPEVALANLTTSGDRHALLASLQHARR